MHLNSTPQQRLKVKSIQTLSSYSLQSLKILQLSHLELKEFLQNKLETNIFFEPFTSVSVKNNQKNPFEISELSFEDFSLLKREKEDPDFFHNVLQDREEKKDLEKYSFFQSREEDLQTQINQFFSDPKTKQIAYIIIHNLDEKGFFKEDPCEIANLFHIPLAELEKVRATICTTFSPLGLASSCLQEFLSLQAAGKFGSTHPLTQLLKFHYTDFVRCRFQKLSKRLKLEKTCLQRLAHEKLPLLQFFPYPKTSSSENLEISIDLSILYDQKKWVVEVTQDGILTNFALNPHYLLVYQSAKKEERSILKFFYQEAMFLKKAILQRQELLKKIGYFIIERQKPFFEHGKPLEPMLVKETSTALQVHPSTISRALQGKYLSCDQGIFPLRSFFSKSLNPHEISKKLKVLIYLKKIIENENKQSPLSDELLQKKLSDHAICCSRRTVAKYRKNLKILPAIRRKTFIDRPS